jgi:hypothetical protein
VPQHLERQAHTGEVRGHERQHGESTDSRPAPKQRRRKPGGGVARGPLDDQPLRRSAARRPGPGRPGSPEGAPILSPSLFGIRAICWPGSRPMKMISLPRIMTGDP